MITSLTHAVALTVAYVDGNSYVIKLQQILFKSSYVVMNCIIYGWRTKPYQQYIKKLINCKQSQVNVA